MFQPIQPDTSENKSTSRFSHTNFSIKIHVKICNRSDSRFPRSSNVTEVKEEKRRRENFIDSLS